MINLADTTIQAGLIGAAVSILISLSGGLLTFFQSSKQVTRLVDEKMTESLVAAYVTERSIYLDEVDTRTSAMVSKLRDGRANAAASEAIEVYRLTKRFLDRFTSVAPKEALKQLELVDNAKQKYLSCALSDDNQNDADALFQEFVSEILKDIEIIKSS